ncbi:hypothetical protein FisN_2Hh525 [Fistulifera solaris]|uniref:Protein kinase domain-containing protein n=1 Tax=Fistulifera solaris TaxID=1519565 RepID=A0A1Z5JGB2_FISSO|nr:hypothetical protein FisN_2Hh525 [Fistulifera solaris]|eukprot:GAX13043.1 hypothetical protein FisN_2Hh525 [Fistulifera solaris]
MPAIPTSVEGHDLSKLLKIAEKTVKAKTDNSQILDLSLEERIPKFESSELTLGTVLGRGGFCVVNEIVAIKLKDVSQSASNAEKVADDDINHIVQDRSFMQANCLRGKGKDCRYAIKKLQDTSFNDASTFINGVVDLAVEARFLAVIRHPNIIKMRATCLGKPFSPEYFVVLDRLYDIMGQRITKWKKKQPKGLGRMMDRKGKKELAFWLERVTVAYDLGCAIKYLHDSNIIYRDIKPDNIGFDVRDDVKLFDLGLVKEIDPNARDIDGNFKLTGDTGSPRYMAPEIALHKPYNENVDVYSFCILMWQMFKMETPFEGYNMGMFQKKVVAGGARPAPDSKWPPEINNMLRRGWGDAKQRPSMEGVCEVLRNEISQNSDEEINEILDASRKSEMSLHRGF